MWKEKGGDGRMGEVDTDEWKDRFFTEGISFPFLDQSVYLDCSFGGVREVVRVWKTTCAGAAWHGVDFDRTGHNRDLLEAPLSSVYLCISPYH